MTIIKIAYAQTISKPSVPSFTVKYADHSYDVPANTSIDPFTGKDVTNPSQHIENKTIQISVKNQTINTSEYLFYEIRMKGHFSSEWMNISFIQANPSSDYTSLVYSSSGEGIFYFSGQYFTIPSDGSIDFQVQAQVWTYVQSGDVFRTWNQVMVAASDWSSTQTITTDSNSTAIVPDGSLTISPLPTNQLVDSQGIGLLSVSWEQTAIILFALIVAALVVALVFLRKRSKTATQLLPNA